MEVIDLIAFIFSFFIAKILLKYKKYWTHHERKNVYDVSNFLFKVFAELFSKSDPRPYYLLASSIATATSTVILSLWVVTCADETHHLYVSGNRRRACELCVSFSEYNSKEDIDALTLSLEKAMSRLVRIKR